MGKACFCALAMLLQSTVASILPRAEHHRIGGTAYNVSFSVIVGDEGVGGDSDHAGRSPQSVLIQVPELHITLQDLIPSKESPNSDDSKTPMFSSSSSAQFLSHTEENQYPNMKAPRIVKYDAMADSVNRSRNPCSNFYRFVCDGWQAAHPVDQKTLFISNSVLVQQKVQKDVIDLIRHEEHLLKTPEGTKARIYYMKCVDMEERNRVGSSAVLRMLNNVRKSESITDWLMSVRTSFLFHSIHVREDEYNATHPTLEMEPEQPFYTYSVHEKGTASAEMTALSSFLTTVMTYLMKDDELNEIFPEDASELPRRVRSFLAVDRIVAKLHNEYEKNQEDILLNVEDLQKHLPAVDWQRVITNFLPSDVLARLETDQLLVLVRSDQLALRLDDLSTIIDPVILRDYLDWKAILAYVPFLDQRYINALQKLQSNSGSMSSNFQSGTLTEHCSSSTLQQFPDVVGAAYIRNYFNVETIPEVRKMLKNIREATIEIIKENSWMDEGTKNKAIKKAAAMRDHIGYHESLHDESIMEKAYGELFITEEMSYAEIVREFNLWMQRMNMRQLVEDNQESRHSFRMLVLEVNAFYDHRTNQIALPAGMLQKPHFDLSMPRIINYAGMGLIGGHEMTHAFDLKGFLLDEFKDGEKTMSTLSYNTFVGQTLCFIRQYDELLVPSIGMRINGAQTANENIADNGSQRATVRALQKLLQDEEETNFVVERLEDYVPEQIFYMSQAYNWCSNWHPFVLRAEVESDIHTPAEQRVNAVLANDPNFARAFQCSERDEMVAKPRCELW